MSMPRAHRPRRSSLPTDFGVSLPEASAAGHPIAEAALSGAGQGPDSGADGGETGQGPTVNDGIQILIGGG